eukprot:s2133_g10.t1
MAFRLFVGGLPSHCCDGTLWNWCLVDTGIEAVTAYVAAQKDSTLWVGFLRFASYSQLQAALQQLSRRQYETYQVSVKISKDSLPPPHGKGSTGSRNSASDASMQRVPRHGQMNRGCQVDMPKEAATKEVTAKPSDFGDLTEKTLAGLESPARTLVVSPTEPANSPLPQLQMNLQNCFLQRPALIPTAWN